MSQTSLRPSPSSGPIADPPQLLLPCLHRQCREGVPLSFVLGMAYGLPFRDRSFDRVVPSLLFHHLTRENKLRTLREIFRILQSGGELHIADWGKPQNALMGGASRVVQIADGAETTEDNLRGQPRAARA